MIELDSLLADCSLADWLPFESSLAPVAVIAAPAAPVSVSPPDPLNIAHESPDPLRSATPTPHPYPPPFKGVSTSIPGPLADWSPMTGCSFTVDSMTFCITVDRHLDSCELSLDYCLQRSCLGISVFFFMFNMKNFQKFSCWEKSKKVLSTWKFFKIWKFFRLGEIKKCSQPENFPGWEIQKVLSCEHFGVTENVNFK